MGPTTLPLKLELCDSSHDGEELAFKDRGRDEGLPIARGQLGVNRRPRALRNSPNKGRILAKTGYKVRKGRCGAQEQSASTKIPMKGGWPGAGAFSRLTSPQPAVPSFIKMPLLGRGPSRESDEMREGQVTLGGVRRRTEGH